MIINPIKTMFNRVYYVHSPDPDLTLNLIAIRPRLMDHRIEWEDTSWGTRFEIADIDMDKGETDEYPREIKIRTKEGQKIILSLLNLENYNRHVKEWVVGQKNFNSDEELQQYYLKTDFLSY